MTVPPWCDCCVGYLQNDEVQRCAERVEASENQGMKRVPEGMLKPNSVFRRAWKSWLARWLRGTIGGRGGTRFKLTGSRRRLTLVDR